MGQQVSREGSGERDLAAALVGALVGGGVGRRIRRRWRWGSGQGWPYTAHGSQQSSDRRRHLYGCERPQAADGRRSKSRGGRAQLCVRAHAQRAYERPLAHAARCALAAGDCPRSCAPTPLNTCSYISSCSQAAQAALRLRLQRGRARSLAWV